MTRIILCFLLVFSSFSLTAQNWLITEVGQLPEQVTNNPVCEGWQGDTLYIYSFGGIDNSLVHSGIHLRSFRFNTVTQTVENLPDLPDTLGKLGVAANRIGDIIYVTGGYHVLSGGSEITSDKVHRFNTQTNSWLTDAPGIPLATDDHVQSVWKDSLLYLVTGWRNTTNIQHCQIFDPANNTWLSGTSTPNSHDYKSFGASGIIIGDTILYYGGTSSWNFNPQNKLRMGVINPNDPTDVNWSISTPDASIYGYRMASTKVNNQAHWIGGSTLSYNFDGIDYNGSGVVAPSNRDLFIESGTNWWYQQTYDTIPMDLRGIGNATDSVKYIMGGMFDNQVVSDRIYKLEFIGSQIAALPENEKSSFSIFPNPSSGIIEINGITTLSKLRLYSSSGLLINEFINTNTIDISNLESGIYILHINANNIFRSKKIIKQ
jgi:hypothetical protein